MSTDRSKFAQLLSVLNDKKKSCSFLLENIKLVSTPKKKWRRFNAIVSQLWLWPFWVMFLKLWLKVVHIDQRQNMNWPLADNFKATNMTFLTKKLASNVQSSCIDNSKWPKSELWHYCIKATNYYWVTFSRQRVNEFWVTHEPSLGLPSLKLPDHFRWHMSLPVTNHSWKYLLLVKGTTMHFIFHQPRNHAFH